MNTVLAQSATQLTVTPNGGEENFDFAASVNRAANRNAKGLTRERQMLNRQKLVATVCADYRAHFAAIYGKTERLPSAVFARIEESVDVLIDRHLSAVNRGNVTSMRRAFAHKANDLMFVERVTVVGENSLSLAEQKLGCLLAIGACEKRLRDLEAKPTPDFDREKQIKGQLMKLEMTRNFIDGEIKNQKEVTSTAPVA